MKHLKPSVHLILGAVLSLFAAQAVSADSYAEDRAEIENLMATYLFALDLRDADAYAGTFTEDGVIDHAGGVERGRAEIREFMEGLAERERMAREARDSALPRPIPSRHMMGNLELEITGDTATGRAYWSSMSVDDNRKAHVSEYGFYEDEYRRVNGKWLFSKRLIVNEFREGREYGVVTSGE